MDYEFNYELIFFWSFSRYNYTMFLLVNINLIKISNKKLGCVKFENEIKINFVTFNFNCDRTKNNKT